MYCTTNYIVSLKYMHNEQDSINIMIYSPHIKYIPAIEGALCEVF